MTMPFAFIGMPQGMEWVVILVLFIVIFGRYLPDVGRFLGRQFGWLRKSYQAIDDHPDSNGPAKP